MRINKNEIADYAKKYEEKFSADIELEKQFFDWFRKSPFLNKEQFVQLGRWKTKRQTKNYLRNDEHIIEASIRKALESDDEEIRIRTLMELHGVSWAVASVILHFAFPNQYPILDFRAIWSFELEQPKSYNFAFWEKYFKLFHKLVDDTKLSGRQIDRALWMFSKLHQNKS